MPLKRRVPALHLALWLWLFLCIATQAQQSRRVDTVARLLTLQVSTAQATATVRGLLSIGDGGGGTFRWDAASTAPTNRGVVFAPSGMDQGRWLRQVAGPLNPLWFGARPDGVTTNTAALQDMIYEAERTANTIHFPKTKLPFATGNLWISNKVNLRITGEASQVKLVYDPGSVIDYGAGAAYAIKAVFMVVGSTNSTAPGLISGFNFTCAMGIPNVADQTSGSVYAVVLHTSDRWAVRRNTFDMDGNLGVGNSGSFGALVEGNTFKNCGLQSGIGYRNSIVYGGTNINLYAQTNYLARGCQGYTVRDNDFYGATDRRFVFFSAAPDFICESNRFHNVRAGGTNMAGLRPGVWQPVIVCYVGDVGWADNAGIFQTNFVGRIQGNKIRYTGSAGIVIRGDEQQSSITNVPAANRIDVSTIQMRVQVTGNTLRSTSTNGAGISLYTARKVLVQGNTVVAKASPLNIYGDCSGAMIRDNRLESTDQGAAQASTLWISSSASGNKGSSEDLLFDRNTIVSGPKDGWFLRSAAPFGSDLRNATFSSNQFFFFGAHAVDKGAPRLFDISDARGTLTFSGNTFWITNTMNGRTLLSISAIGTNTALVFNGNRFLGMPGFVSDVRGLNVQNFAEVVIKDNRLGALDVRRSARAVLSGNDISSSSAGPRIYTESVTNVLVMGNTVRQTAASKDSPIQLGGAGASTLRAEGNRVEGNTSSPLIVARTSGSLVARDNRLANAGTGGTKPAALAGAVLE